MKDRIPEFRDEKEEARFWATHDSTDFQSELKKDRLTKFVQRQNPAGAMKYCLGCSYCLEGLTEHRCPECGRRFDPVDEDSFVVQPAGQRSDSFGKLLLIAACIGMLFVLSLFGGSSTTLFVVGFCLQAVVLLIGLVSAVFRLSHASWARAAAILIAVFQLGASILLLAMARALFRFI